MSQYSLGFNYVIKEIDDVVDILLTIDGAWILLGDESNALKILCKLHPKCRTYPINANIILIADERSLFTLVRGEKFTYKHVKEGSFNISIHGQNIHLFYEDDEQTYVFDCKFGLVMTYVGTAVVHGGTFKHLAKKHMSYLNHKDIPDDEEDKDEIVRAFSDKNSIVVAENSEYDYNIIYGYINRKLKLELDEVYFDRLWYVGTDYTYTVIMTNIMEYHRSALDKIGTRFLIFDEELIEKYEIDSKVANIYHIAIVGKYLIVYGKTIGIYNMHGDNEKIEVRDDD